MDVGTNLERLAFGTSVEPEVQVHLRPTTLLAGRCMLSLIFVLSGLMKLGGFTSSLEFMHAKGIVHGAALFLAVALVVEIIAGFMLMTGTLTRVAGLILFLYLIPVTLIFHDFWNQTGADHQMQMINFLKNVAIMGGLLSITACGPGRYSVDRRLELKE